jgi:hypothetical protein
MNKKIVMFPGATGRRELCKIEKVALHRKEIREREPTTTDWASPIDQCLL